jgi:hypothetical protein
LREFENRALRTISEPKEQVAAGGWRKLHSEEPHKLYASPKVINVIKARRMR